MKRQAKKRHLLKLLTGSWDDFPATWSEAFHSKQVYYFTGKPCRKGHVAPRAVGGHKCMMCSFHAL